MKEFVKSLLLITLTMTALILTGAIFSRPTTEVVVPQIEYNPNDLIEFIRPQNYVFSFGDLFIKIYDDEYQGIQVKSEIKESFKRFIDVSTKGSGKQLNKKPIDKSEWESGVRRKSVTLNFPYTIPLSDFLGILGYEVEPTNEIESVKVTSVLMLLNTRNEIYFYDGEADNYFKLTGEESPKWLENVFSEVAEHHLEHDRYLPLEDRYALLKTSLRDYELPEANMLLTPRSTDVRYPKYEITSSSSGSVLDDIAGKVFDNELSFVRKSVYEDNEVIYMYGYGEKVLKYNVDGSLDYTVKVDQNQTKEPIDFIDGLGKSIDQIKKMGNTLSDTLYLSSYQQVESQNAVETIYYFNFTKNGIPYYLHSMQGGDLIEVRFINKELVKVKMNSYFYIKEEDVYESRNFAQIFAKHKIQFVLDYEQQRPLSTIEKKDLEWMCLQEMESLELKYEVIGDELIPTWHIKILDNVYRINLINAEIIRD